MPSVGGVVGGSRHGDFAETVPVLRRSPAGVRNREDGMHGSRLRLQYMHVRLA